MAQSLHSPVEQNQTTGRTMDYTSAIALSRMMTLRQRMDITANNIANMNTSGYKNIELLLKTDQVKPSATGVKPLDSRPIAMAAEWGTVRDTRVGEMRMTGNPLDVALQDKGYFVITNAAGEERYTRNGVFQINNAGQLVDLAGNAVMGDGGQINIPPGTKEVMISSDGTISTPKGKLGRLRVVDFKDEQALEPDGGNGLKTTDANPPEPSEKPRVVQGAVEGSNVNAVNEMTNMVEIQRQYQAAANILQEEHDRARNAIKSLAKLS